jgi:hypothetical protein
MKKSLAVLGLLSLLMVVPVSASAALTSTQVNAIISLLQVFGASQSVVNGVKDVLLGEDNPSELANLEVRILNGDAQCVTAPCEVTYNKYVEVTVYEPGSRELLKKLATSTGKVTFYDLPVGSYIVDVRGKESQALGTATVSVGKELKVDVVVKESTPSITVISPNGGEVYKQDETIPVKWEMKNPNNRDIWVDLFNEGGKSVSGIHVQDGATSYSLPTFSSDGCCGRVTTIPGKYRIRLSLKDPNLYPTSEGLILVPFDFSDNYFTITDSGIPANQPPVIQMHSWQRLYKEGYEITLSVKAVDPENGSLSYRIEWGDTNANITTVKSGETITIPHLYKQAGNYTVSIKVRDDKNQETQNTTLITLSDINNPSNLPPVIRTFYGPTTVRPYAAGTWQIRASDPEGKKLTYDINWGEGVATTTGSLPSNGSLSITHKYKKVGQYRINLVITDADRGLASKSLVVNVTSSGQAAAGSASPGILERLSNWFSR